eukprot:2050989-Rhodomonas_salina.1
MVFTFFSRVWSAAVVSVTNVCTCSGSLTFCVRFFEWVFFCPFCFFLRPCPLVSSVFCGGGFGRGLTCTLYPLLSRTTYFLCPFLPFPPPPRTLGTPPGPSFGGPLRRCPPWC